MSVAIVLISVRNVCALLSWPLQGQKEFIIARPTPENLRAFEQWMWLEKRDRSESWLGAKLTECYRCAARATPLLSPHALLLLSARSSVTHARAIRCFSLHS